MNNPLPYSVDQKAGDYRVKVHHDGCITIDRHDKPWQSCGVPENASVILALVHELEAVRAELEKVTGQAGLMRLEREVRTLQPDDVIIQSMIAAYKAAATITEEELHKPSEEFPDGFHCKDDAAIVATAGMEAAASVLITAINSK